MIKKNDTPVINTCKLCAPLGASLVYKGIENTIPLLHGSQGCATYIRRYFIGHFRDPVDIASSSFHEDSVVFGGKSNIITAVENIISQYNPELIGIAATCLSETIGDDPAMYLREYIENNKGKKLPKFIVSSTPSYLGTHQDGYNQAMKSVIKTIAKKNGNKKRRITVLNNFFSCGDIRFIKDFFLFNNIEITIFPDYSDTLDGAIWKTYRMIPEGGTKLSDIEEMGDAETVFEFGDILSLEESAGKILKNDFGSNLYSLPIPIGINNSDKFINAVEKISGHKINDRYFKERGRLLDAYSDAHKYVFGKRVLVYGEDDLVCAIAGFLSEIGMIPVICATGRKSVFFKDRIEKITGANKEVIAFTDASFDDMESYAAVLGIDMLVGNSRGYKIAKNLSIPFVRIGFPIQDRFGGQRIRVLGYSGTMDLFDRMVNAIIEKKQMENKVGYMSM